MRAQRECTKQIRHSKYSSAHAYVSRQCHQLRPPTPRLSKLRHSTPYLGPILLNNIP